MSVNILAGVSTKILWNQYGFVMSVGWNRKNRPKPNSIVKEIIMSKDMEYVELACRGGLGEGCKITQMCKVDFVAVKPEYEHKVREIAVKRVLERLKFEHDDGRHPIKQEKRDF